MVWKIRYCCCSRLNAELVDSTEDREEKWKKNLEDLTLCWSG